MPKCRVEGCGSWAVGLGFCHKHYQQIKRLGEIKSDKPKICRADGCGEPCHARGMCKKHYNDWYREQKLKQKK